MPKTPAAESPASAMNAATQALADERKLNVHLDQIIEFEKARNAASESIRKTWIAIKRAGFDEAEARSALVRRAIAG